MFGIGRFQGRRSPRAERIRGPQLRAADVGTVVDIKPALQRTARLCPAEALRPLRAEASPRRRPDTGSHIRYVWSK